MLKGKKILLGVTGGIAAYKAVELASTLTKSGAKVKTILTKSACQLVNPLTFKSITHRSVSTEIFNLESEIEHITLADWADLIVIAPATANMIGKVASGICDDLLSTTIMATSAPVLFVPAMNVHMYSNQILQNNIEKLTQLGYYFMEPESGKLACGYEGKGRFPVITEIKYHIETFLNYSQDLTDKDILITTGSCRENIDPMRFMTNHSSGRMGLALARAAHIRGAKVKVIAGIVQENIPEYINALQVENAEDMYQAVTAEASEHQMIIMAAAVSDFTPVKTSQQKIKKTDSLTLKLKKTKDILQELGDNKQKDQILIGFAAESEDLEKNARIKLKKKHLDLIIANNIAVAGQQDTAILILGENITSEFSGSKFSVAHKILDFIYYEK
jgi:phosphopantothenoylcysteine decarboxylase / phosphopantothenate---cysteine ligase